MVFAKNNMNLSDKVINILILLLMDSKNEIIFVQNIVSVILKLLQGKRKGFIFRKFGRVLFYFACKNLNMTISKSITRQS